MPIIEQIVQNLFSNPGFEKLISGLHGEKLLSDFLVFEVSSYIERRN